MTSNAAAPPIRIYYIHDGTSHLRAIFFLSLLRLVLLFGPPEEVVFDEEELVRLRDVVLRGLFTTIMGGSFVIGSIQLH